MRGRLRAVSLLAVGMFWVLASGGGAYAQTTTATATAPPGAARPGRVWPQSPPDQPLIKPAANGQPDTAWVRRHEGFVQIAQKGDIDLYFLGDSITDFWANRGRAVFQYYYAGLKTCNFGISGDATEHVLWRIENGEFENVKPKVVVLMIGTNNFGHWPGVAPEAVARGNKEIINYIQKKSPATKVLLLAIFPRADGQATPEIKAKIAATNEILKTYDNGTTVRYLDLGPKFLAADGTLPRDIMPDFLHPSDKGYRIWAENMNPLLFGMLGLLVPAPMPAATEPASAPATQ